MTIQASSALRLAATGLLGIVVSAGEARPGQPAVENPVYVDDAPAATQVLSQIGSLVDRGNEGEAVRALQRLLETEPDRLVADSADTDLFRPVRTLVHRALLERPALLERFRITADPLAARLLEEGDPDRVERTLLLTAAGFDAALLIAQRHLESASFDAAALTLAQLDRHPDGTGERAAAAASLLATIARYTRSEEDARRAAAWARQAGAPLSGDAIAPIEPPAAARRSGYGSFDTMSEADVERLLPRPLRSIAIDPQMSEADRRLAPPQPTPWVLPTVAGEMLLVNDGERVAAFDAASLERIWTHEPDTQVFQNTELDRARRSTSALQDTQTVTAGGGVALAVTGDAIGRRRIGDPRLHAFALDSGELVWNARPAGVDELLGGATIFGPPVISGDTAVVGFFTFSPLRRVHVAHLAGLDLYTGETRWVRLVGTAGVLPSQRSVDVAPVMLLRRGIIYRVEPLGVIAAIEAHSGRPVWTRRVPASGEEPPIRDVWEQPVPIDADGSVLAFSPDGTRLLRLDPLSGAVTGSRRMSEIGWPDYMLRAGDEVVLINDTRVQSVSVAEAVTAAPKSIALDGAPVFGRGVVSGERVLLPTERGVLVIDPARRTVRRVPLEHGGSPAVAQGQLMVYGAEAVHGYLDWSSAERVLADRIEANPADPQHAIALAELAYRAGRAERVPSAADAALEAIRRVEDADRASEAGDRLVAALSTILDGDRTLTGRQRGEIVSRLGTAARTPDQRVGYLMHLARWQDEQGDHREAAETYQSILLDETLARSNHSSSWRRQRADLAATGALESLIEREGASVYRAFDRDAQSQLNEIALPRSTEPGTPAPESRLLAQQFERVARAYPLARVAPEAWLDAATAHDDAGDSRQSRAALHAGFDAAVRLTKKRADAAIVAELAGRLATRLAEDDRAFEATSVIRRTRALLGDLRLTIDGTTVDARSVEAGLLRALAERDRPARVAPLPQRMVQLLEGWTIVAPASRAGPLTASHIMLRSDTHGVVALWSIAGEPTAPLGFAPTDRIRDDIAAADALRPIWSRPLGEVTINEPRLIQLTPARALLYRGAHGNATVEAIDTVTGATRWTSPAFASLFESSPPRYATGVIETPLDGRAWLRDQVIAFDDRYLAIVERTGRAVVIELETGDIAWSTQLDVPGVYEASLHNGVLAVIGERAADPARGEDPGVVPLAAAYDIRSRTTLFGPRHLGSFARWVRHRGTGPLLIGLDSGVVAVDLSRGEEQWTVDDPAVRLSGDAWIMRDRAYVLGADRQLWQIDLTNGRLRTDALEDLGRIGQANEVEASLLPSGDALFVSTEGMVVFDPAGRLIGGDGFDGTRAFRLPVVAEGLTIAVDARTLTIDVEAAAAGEITPFGFVSLDSQTGRIAAEAILQLPGFPRSLVALDDLILVGLPSTTAVYHAPFSDE